MFRVITLANQNFKTMGGFWSLRCRSSRGGSWHFGLSFCWWSHLQPMTIRKVDRIAEFWPFFISLNIKFQKACYLDMAKNRKWVPMQWHPPNNNQLQTPKNCFQAPLVPNNHFQDFRISYWLEKFYHFYILDELLLVLWLLENYRF